MAKLEKNEDVVNQFEAEMSDKMVLGMDIKALLERKRQMKQAINTMSLEHQGVEKNLMQVINEVSVQKNILDNLEAQVNKKSIEALNRIAEKEAKLDIFIKDYEKSVKDQAVLLKEQKERTGIVREDARKNQEERERLEKWVKDREKSLSEREKAYSDSQKSVSDDMKSLKKAKEEAEEAQKGLKVEKDKLALLAKELEAKQEALVKDRQTIISSKDRLEKEHKEEMAKVILLKASVEGTKKDQAERETLIEEKRLKVVALENRVEALIKRYNLEKEAKQ